MLIIIILMNKVRNLSSSSDDVCIKSYWMHRV